MSPSLLRSRDLAAAVWRHNPLGYIGNVDRQQDFPGRNIGHCNSRPGSPVAGPRSTRLHAGRHCLGRHCNIRCNSVSQNKLIGLRFYAPLIVISPSIDMLTLLMILMLPTVLVLVVLAMVVVPVTLVILVIRICPMGLMPIAILVMTLRLAGHCYDRSECWVLPWGR